MSDMSWVTMTHPDLPGEERSLQTLEAFETIYEPKGWELALPVPGLGPAGPAHVTAVEKDEPYGVAGLDALGKLDPSVLPAGINDIETAAMVEGASAAQNRAALQTAIDNAIGPGNPVSSTRTARKRVRIPPGVFYIDQPITIRSVMGLVIEGDGYSELRATSNMTSVFDINGLAYSSIGGFTIKGDVGVQVDNGIYLYWDSAGAQRSTSKNVFHDIVIHGLDYVAAFRVGKPGAAVQVDNDEFRNITITGDWTTGNTTRYQYGLLLGSNSAGNNLVHHCYHLTIGRNRYNVYVDNSQIAIYGAGFDTGETDVFTGITGFIELHGIRSENSERFLVTGGPTTVAPMITVSDVLWSADTMNADGQWIKLQVGGSVVLTNIALKNAGATIPKIIAGSVTPLRVLINGFSVRGTASPYNLPDLFTFSTGGTVTVRGYGMVNSAGQVTHAQDWTGPTNTPTQSTYTFVSRDSLLPHVAFNRATAVTATVPPFSTVPAPVGTKIVVYQMGVGQVTLAPGSGVTLSGAAGLKTRAQHSVVTLTNVAADVWVVSGDTAV